MPIGTTFDPVNINSFDKTKLQKNAFGITATALAGQETNIDYTLADDLLVLSGELLTLSGAVAGDKVSFQILYGDTVVGQFMTDWNIDPSKVLQASPKSYYPGKLQAGLKMRVVYKSVGVSDVVLAINYDTEMVLLTTVEQNNE